MKRLGAILLLCLFALGAFSGCSDAGRNLGDIVTSRREAMNKNQAASSEAKPVPIETYQDGNFAPSLGFNVTAYPNSTSLRSTQFFVIDGWFGQIQFKSSGGLDLVLRVAKQDAGYLTITYQELHSASDSTRTLDGVEVRTRNAPAGCSMVTWERGDFQFLLHSNTSQGQLPQNLVDEVVNGTRAEAA